MNDDPTSDELKRAFEERTFPYLYGRALGIIEGFLRCPNEKFMHDRATEFLEMDRAEFAKKAVPL